MKRITDKSFVYVHSGSTDIRKTFERVRREIELAKSQDRANAEERLRKTISIKVRKA